MATHTLQSKHDSYVILLQVLLLVGLGVLQVFVDGSDLPFLVVNGLVEGLQLLLDPLVPLFFGSELAATALLGIQVCALLSGLGQSAIRDRQNKQKRRGSKAENQLARFNQ